MIQTGTGRGWLGQTTSSKGDSSGRALKAEWRRLPAGLAVGVGEAGVKDSSAFWLPLSRGQCAFSKWGW